MVVINVRGRELGELLMGSQSILQDKNLVCCMQCEHTHTFTLYSFPQCKLNSGGLGDGSSEIVRQFCSVLLWLPLGLEAEQTERGT